jgi:SWI/SNF-related matrix-associated actin-dependent regulator of chromatin subfamily A-like protein 1
MRLRLVASSIFVADSSYEERTLPKAADFLWHGGNCRPGCAACAAGLGKVWWTRKPENAARLAEYADDAARSALEHVIATVEASRATSAAPAAVAAIPVPPSLAYLAFQAAGIAYAMARPSTLIADEMGLGKTVQALGVANADPACHRVLVVCPASLRENWRREATRWLVRPTAVVIVSTPAELQAALAPTSDVVVICNYDKLVGTKGKAFHTALMAQAWDCLVVDEAHFLKNPKAKRTVAVIGKPQRRDEIAVPGLASRARRFLALTGTPILNRPVEIQPLLSVLAPREFGSFFGFVKRYCGAYQGKYGWDFSGATHLDELQQRLRSTCMVRRLKRDVLTELPAKRRQVVVLPTNGAAKAVEAERQAYAAHEAQLEELRADADLAHAAGDADGYATAVAQLREAARVAFAEISQCRHDTAVAKIPAVVEHVTNMLEEGVNKVVVFVHHHDVAHALAGEFGREAVTLTGETAMDVRTKAVDRFQTDPSVHVFIGSIQAAGVGLTLTAASHVVFAELDWVPGNVTQAEDRCHRIGQTESVLVQHLVLDGSLDARMAQVLVAKQSISDAALDDVPALPEPEQPRAARPRKYPAATAIQRSAAAQALQYLSACCDGAHAKDGMGFNKIDSRVGKSLAARSEQRALTDGEVWLAVRLATTYHRQLDAELLAALK